MLVPSSESSQGLYHFFQISTSFLNMPVFIHLRWIQVFWLVVLLFSRGPNYPHDWFHRSLFVAEAARIFFFYFNVSKFFYVFYFLYEFTNRNILVYKFGPHKSVVHSYSWIFAKIIQEIWEMQKWFNFL